jgi:hypothetical protein
MHTSVSASDVPVYKLPLYTLIKVSSLLLSICITFAAHQHACCVHWIASFTLLTHRAATHTLHNLHHYTHILYNRMWSQITHLDWRLTQSVMLTSSVAQTLSSWLDLSYSYIYTQHYSDASLHLPTQFMIAILYTSLCEAVLLLQFMHTSAVLPYCIC